MNVPLLRASFNLKRPVRRAVLYTTALGLYDVHLNGRRVGDQVLAPDWTDYRKRVRYQVNDVTALVKNGDNALGAMLANGSYSGHIGNGGYQFFGKTPAFLAQLELTYADGHSERVVSDGSWKWRASAILSSDFMMGEDYDARLEVPGWDQPGFDEKAWLAVTTITSPDISLEAQVMEPVRQVAELKPKSVKEPKPGHWVYDLGQNMVGVVRLALSAPAGTQVTVRHAEMLNPDGTLLHDESSRGSFGQSLYVQGGRERSLAAPVYVPRFSVCGIDRPALQLPAAS